MKNPIRHLILPGLAAVTLALAPSVLVACGEKTTVVPAEKTVVKERVVEKPAAKKDEPRFKAKVDKDGPEFEVNIK